MHELSVCLALLEQVSAIAQDHRATGVTRILLRVGPLSGVEPLLLQQAFPLAAAGTLAADAELRIEPAPVRVRCTRCGTESPAPANRLVCPACGEFRTRLLSGDELLLAQVELVLPEGSAASGPPEDRPPKSC